MSNYYLSSYVADPPTPKLKVNCLVAGDKKFVDVYITTENYPSRAISGYKVTWTINGKAKTLETKEPHYKINDIPNDCTDFSVTVKVKNTKKHFQLKQATCDKKLKCEVCSKY